MRGRILTAALVVATAALPSGTAAAAAPTEAQRVFESEWPEIAEREVHAPGPADDASVRRYLGESIARLDAPRGERRLLLSTRPLRAEGPDGLQRPVDLSLRDEGAVRAPAVAPFELEIGEHPRAGFTIGPDAERAITVRPLGAAGGAVADVEGKLFYPDTHEDTDTLLMPVIEGLESFEQLRTPDAPEAFSYRLELTERHRARFDGGGVYVAYDGADVLHVLPPVARDASGRDVPAAMTLDGDVLTVTVDHAGGGFDYPVMLDPTWASSYDYRTGPATGNEGLYFEQTPGGPWYDLFAFEHGTAGGIWAQPIGGRVYPENTTSKIRFFPPGTTRILSAHWRHVSHNNNAHRQTMRLALYGGPTPVVFDRSTTANGFVDQDVLLTDPHGAGAAEMWLFTPPCTPDDDDCPRFIPAGGGGSFASVGALDLELTDVDYPTVSASGTLRSMANTWSAATGTRTLTFGAADGGSGVLSYEAIGTDAGGDHLLRRQVAACNPEHTTFDQGGNICPTSQSIPISFNSSQLPEGATTFRVRAEDLAGNTTEAGGTGTSWRVYVDRTAPTIAAGGQLGPDAEPWTTATGDLAVRLAAADARSGVAAYRLRAYDDSGRLLLDDTTNACVSPGPIAAPCASSHASTLTLDGNALPDGEVRFVAGATDYAGNASSQIEWTVRLDRHAPVVRAVGEATRLDGDWTGETDDLAVQLRGRDIGAGLEALQLVARNGEGRTVLATVDACPGGDPCPAELDQTVQIDAGELPDGRTSFEAVAIDAAGNLSEDGTDWDTYFDHTAPDAPRAVTIRPKDPGTIEVSWDRPPDNEGGSGIAGYEYQVQVEGEPATVWQTTKVPLAKLGGLPPGKNVQVLVRALDGARNVGRTRGGKARIAGGPDIQSKECLPTSPRGVTHDRPGDPRKFVELTTDVEMGFDVTCPTYDKLTKLKIVSIIQYDSGEGWKQIGERRTDWIGRGDFPEKRYHPAHKRIHRFAKCTPGAGGDKKYRIVAKITHHRRGGLPYTRENHTTKVGLHCPTTEERRYRQAESFKILASYHPNPSNNQVRDARVHLRKILGDEPWKPDGTKNAWQAHHVVPYADGRARAMRALLFRCTIHPNAYLNGAWLRGAGLRKTRSNGSDNPDYDTLRRRRSDLAMRTYHGDTFQDAYFTAANRIFGGTFSADESCGGSYRRRVVTALKRIKGRLYTGTLGIEHPEH